MAKNGLRAFTPREIARLVERRRGVLLDVSFGGTPQKNAVVLAPRGNIRRDPTRLPLPLPTGCVHTAVVTHVLDFIEPSEFFRWFDELHRTLRVGGFAYFSGPYGGDDSHGWLSEPQHRIRIVEETFAWLDPRTPLYGLHPTVGRRQPRPWRIVSAARVPGAAGTSTISYNVQLQAVKK